MSEFSVNNKKSRLIKSGGWGGWSTKHKQHFTWFTIIQKHFSMPFKSCSWMRREGRRERSYGNVGEK
jgi:hypothetical protein